MLLRLRRCEELIGVRVALLATHRQVRLPTRRPAGRESRFVAWASVLSPERRQPATRPLGTTRLVGDDPACAPPGSVQIDAKTLRTRAGVPARAADGVQRADGCGP